MNEEKTTIEFIQHKNEFKIAKSDLTTGKIVINNIEITSIEDWNKVTHSIVELQQENARLKDKIEKVIEYVNHYESIKGYYEYEECGYDEYNYEEDLKEELLELLKEN